ncbi:carnitine dehydratase [Burkholderia contaminans FFH2055]|uniref:CaiB/BaiF CoA transferase family protein n=1 Tax=Burkholderia TaxID=32008 RepID=UPI000626C784|nr:MULTISPECIES: CaiB/BaiF CoA-transferase family protein [Burkholderia]AKM44775.1 carnitine dehydratase [Burkholderia contaminans]AOL09032.1 carnitine dehydratase [Burkholderia contaminans]ELK6461402.1 CoA transferase [Burkholderia contaminans]KKL35188.1 carnitine dehydratase [Burkholderia contaminans FFH2055]MEB4640083.1 CaiB/BaiF CoA-transferase family protein [Burkholderia contaminans]
MQRCKGQGPLAGLKVVEIGGIGPLPFCAMLLADLGADVLRIDRIVPSDSGVLLESRFDLLRRSRRSIAMDLKNGAAVEVILRLVEGADAVIEGFRPGVAERLGVGPDDCLAVNPKVVYGRMTGWGQDGPLADAPGHDLNYIGLTGALHSIGSENGPPVPPLNLVGDFGGGSLYLALGVVSAMLEARSSGQGQVVDAAMVDGSASLMTLIYGMHAGNAWIDRRGSNRLDSGAPWYQVYETSDGRYVSLASNEPRFYRETLTLLGVADEALPKQHDTDGWPLLRARFAEIFRQKTRDEWCNLAAGTNVCIAPVLSLTEAPKHPHNVARATFQEVAGVVQPGPAPRFSRTPGAIQRPPARIGEHTDEALLDWGFAQHEIDALRNREVIR